ncbi:abortive infection bacteriophage resistance protein [Sphingomonas sp. BE138]|uniref:Abi family protein n=1 Tax=Sphingomonas sp. BE138 TaxID=2817845 RepID=UPI00285BB55B|nr:Abi family protein [Sphingomonas sp. BE138]MDR6789111.1 abortive infection bacteriophage resistance protein [Sphingomonas sp. BE138]
MTRRFAKPALTLTDQIDHLREAGMTVADPARAEQWLRHISYYRLSGYWHIWKDRSVPDQTRFNQGADFDALCALYNFDRDLRDCVGHAIEQVEVALRGSWAYALAQVSGAHGYLDASLYSDRKEFHQMLGKLATETGWSAETYIRHYRETYNEPALPAVWMVAEMMSFGQLSRWYSLLVDPRLRTAIAQPFGLREQQFVSIVKHLVDVRNICAHHGRLWNRGFRSPPQLPRRPRELGASLDDSTAGNAAGKLYNTLVLLLHLVAAIDPGAEWRAELVNVLSAHPNGDLGTMGFPANWRSRPYWDGI